MQLKTSQGRINRTPTGIRALDPGLNPGASRALGHVVVSLVDGCVVVVCGGLSNVFASGVACGSV